MARLTVWLSRPDRRAACCSGPGSSPRGTALRVWAAGHVEKSREVTSSGPYRFTRHPLVSRLDAARPGHRRLGESPVARAGDHGLPAATLGAAIRSEEAHLREKFGTPTTPTPRGACRRATAGSAGRGPSGNREHHAVAGTLAGLALLALKVWYTSEFRRSVSRAVSSVGRAPALHAGCHRFESCTAHHSLADGRGTTCNTAGGREKIGVVVQLVRTLPCHGRGRGFESRRPRQSPR